MVFLEIYGVVVIFKFEGVFGVDIIEDGDEKSLEKQKYSVIIVFGVNIFIVFCNFDRVYIYYLCCYVY